MKIKKNNKIAGRFARTACSVAVAATLLGSAAFGGVKPVNDIRVNQHGYLPSQPKVAVYNGPAGATWELRKANGEVVASGTTTAYGNDNASGDNVSHIDFSSYTSVAKDLTLAVGSSESYSFDVSKFTYAAMKEDAMMYFYHQRFGSPVLAELVGEEFAREAGHLMDSNLECDDNLPSDWDSSSACNYSLDVRGGHQDAGDYGGYVTNGGYYTWLLTYMYEALPGAYPDGSLLIPESGNGIPDILDEARYELDFIARMQVPQNKSPYPGMIHHKKSWQDWAPFPLVPADDDGAYWDIQSKRTIKPVSTSATLNGAATMAQAARVWANFPAADGFDGSSEPYHETLLKRAEIAWDAAVATPDLYASSDASMGSGPYDDTELSDEFYWAAAELYLTTKKDKYKNFLLNSPHFAKYNEFDWQVVNVGGNLSLVLHDATNELTSAQKTQLKNGLKNYADETVATINSEGYLAPLAPTAQSSSCGSANYTYPWGAVGSFMLSNGVQMAAAHQLTNDSKYLNGMTQTMDHVLGTNALDRAYMTGYGENPTTEPHHRFWLKSKGNPVTEFAAAVSVPYPAAVAGGPQNDLVEDGTSGPETNGTPCVEAAKSYGDHWNNYSSNEVTVNWNANLAAVLAFIDDAIPAPADTVAPSAPASVNPVATSGSSIKVTWADAADNSRIRTYTVFVKPEGGVYSEVGSTKFNAFNLVPLYPNTNYCFKISAEDYAGNVSPKSVEECVKTDAASKFEIYYQPDNSAMSDYVGTGSTGDPEAPKANIGNGWYHYQFHTDGPRFDFHFSMPNWGSPQRFSPDGSGSNWRVDAEDFSADGVIWLTSDKQFHKVPPEAAPVEPCTVDCDPVEPENVAPTASNKSATGEQDNDISITLSGSDSDGSVVAYQVEQQPAHGSVSISGNTATYTPDAGYVGNDSFSYSVTDNDGAQSADATVSLTLTAVEVVDGEFSIAMTAPANNASFELGATITLAANAVSEDSGIDKVNFKINGDFYSQDSSAPFNTTWTPTEAGTYTLTARLYNDAGEQLESSTRTITVTEEVEVVEPEYSIVMTAPANNSSFDLGQSITLTADAISTESDVQKVNFRINGSYHSQDRTAPYNTTWTPTAAGTYTVDAVVTNDAGVRLTAASRTVTIVDPDGGEPEVPDTGACSSTINVPWNARTEVTLSAGVCLQFSNSLSNETVQFWDSDVNSSCDFRGTFKSVDGTGSMNVTGNYVAAKPFTGTTLQVQAGYSCNYVKVRAY